MQEHPARTYVNMLASYHIPDLMRSSATQLPPPHPSNQSEAHPSNHATSALSLGHARRTGSLADSATGVQLLLLVTRDFPPTPASNSDLRLIVCNHNRSLFRRHQ